MRRLLQARTERQNKVGDASAAPGPTAGFTDIAGLLAALPFLQHGDSSEFERFLAAADERRFDARMLLEIRRRWAMWRGDFDTFQKIDREHGTLTDDPNDALEETLIAAAVCVMSGDRAGAQRRLGPVGLQLAARVAGQSENASAVALLALARAIEGKTDEARRLADGAVEMMPLTRDHVAGTRARIRRLHVRMVVGDYEAAISELGELLRLPVSDRGWWVEINVHVLRRHLLFAPLRGNPRFQALLTDPKNNAPLF